MEEMRWIMSERERKILEHSRTHTDDWVPYERCPVCGCRYNEWTGMCACPDFEEEVSL